MGKTFSHELTDNLIRQVLTDKTFTDLRDTKTRHRLRINTSRTGGTWYKLNNKNGVTLWDKIGKWPQLSAAELADTPHDNSGKIEPPPTINNPPFNFMRDILNWYLERQLNRRDITLLRKRDIKSAINNRLIPNLGHYQIRKPTPAILDKPLFRPLLQKYQPATVRQSWLVLRSALRAAQKLKVLKHKPDHILNAKFSDFTREKIKPKPSKLRPHDVRDVIEQINNTPDQRAQLLTTLLLLHGTRINETRLIKIKDIDTDMNYLHLPADNTKTRTAHKIPLTDTALSIIKTHLPTRKTGFLFPNNRAGEPFSTMTANKLIKKVSGGQWTAHDLRKLSRTIWAEIGLDYFAAEMLLNHSLKGLDKTYIMGHSDTRMREGLEQYHRFLIERGLKTPNKKQTAK